MTQTKATKTTVQMIPFRRSFISPFKVLNEVRTAALSGTTDAVFAVALERENGYISRYDLPLPAKAADRPEVQQLCERIVKFLLWSSGGWKIMISGPRKICAKIKADYTLGGTRDFDVQFMSKVYKKPLVVQIKALSQLPQTYERALLVDTKNNGYRIGFDLGASDFKISALKKGKVVFSKEFPWDPRNQANPDYHYQMLNEGLKEAASTLPRVDAIGGSTAGVVIDNHLQIASLFRAVEEKNPQRFADAQNIFERLQKEWNVPIEVANDGDVTALTGLMTMGKKGMLGIAMGSSEAAGFIDRKGCLTGRLSELAFAPVDLSLSAPADEWSGDRGVGALAFSQQAVNYIATKRGIKFPRTMPLPERLKVVQQKLTESNSDIYGIYQTIGLLLGYSIPWYREFYGFDNLMILGRVTSGNGGIIIMETARMILEDRFPELFEQVDIFMPDEKARRLGQSVAAASLPEI
ncbi:MAG: ROK family protein [Kiritimatiellae bacterium]|nr:ROK family protein [Kiritimatiellia bacterium]